jgi:hypothetical protein
LIYRWSHQFRHQRRIRILGTLPSWLQSLLPPVVSIVGAFIIVVRSVFLGADIAQTPFGTNTASGRLVHLIVGTKPTVTLFPVEKFLAVLDVLLETILAERDGHVLKFHDDVTMGTSAFIAGAGIVVFKLG